MVWAWVWASKLKFTGFCCKGVALCILVQHYCTKSTQMSLILGLWMEYIKKHIRHQLARTFGARGPLPEWQPTHLYVFILLFWMKILSWWIHCQGFHRGNCGSAWMLPWRHTHTHRRPAPRMKGPSAYTAHWSPSFFLNGKFAHSQNSLVCWWLPFLVKSSINLTPSWMI